MATKPVREKRPPKTIKERKWVKRTLETGDGTKAAMEIYDVTSEDSARGIASQNYGKLSMEEEFKKAGLTHAALAANTTRIAISAKKRDQFSGEIEDDNAMQLKGMEFGAKLMGLVKDNNNNQQINLFNFFGKEKTGYDV